VVVNPFHDFFGALSFLASLSHLFRIDACTPYKLVFWHGGLQVSIVDVLIYFFARLCFSVIKASPFPLPRILCCFTHKPLRPTLPVLEYVGKAQSEVTRAFILVEF